MKPILYFVVKDELFTEFKVVGEGSRNVDIAQYVLGLPCEGPRNPRFEEDPKNND